MTDEIQYEIYIGCRDADTKSEVIGTKELRAMVTEFFKNKEIAFSIVEAEGGYQYEEGIFLFENTLCITIIGDQNLNIIKFAKGLSMYMNQECFMITKNGLNMEYR